MREIANQIQTNNNYATSMYRYILYQLYDFSKFDLEI